MDDAKRANGVILFLTSGREINIKKKLTENYVQFINWLFSEDKFPFKVIRNNDIEEEEVNDFILYKNAIEVIEIKR